jgi:hypothetical protein
MIRAACDVGIQALRNVQNAGQKGYGPPNTPTKRPKKKPKKKRKKK